MRKLVAAAALVVVALSTMPGRAVTVLTDFWPRCQAGATYTCEDLFIDSFDATQIDATLYVPNAAATTPAAAILMTHGYGGWHRGDFAIQQMLASEGYVVLGYTSRGFGRSSGQVQLDSPDYEVRDAEALITWLAKNPAVKLDGPNNPDVGMVGGSYAGGIQLLTAARDSRLDAITPQITWNDLRYSLAPNGVVKHGWTDLLYASGKYAGYFGPIPSGPTPPPAIGTDGVPADQDIQVLSTYLTNDNAELPVAYSDGSSNSYTYLKRRSPTFDDVIDNIKAPTLLIQGQQDTLFTMNEALANARAISAHAPTKLVVFSAGHGYSDLAGERAQINARILSWFDRYLRGNTAAITGPAVEVWKPWVSPFTDFAALPGGIPAATTGAGVAPTSATLVNAVAPTSHTETSNFQQQTNSPSGDLAPGATAADFTTTVAPGTTIAGIPVLRFTVSATTPEAIVFAKLWDVDASGNRTLIHHLTTPVRVRGGKGDFCGNPIPAPITSTLVSNVDVCLPMFGIVWRVEAGHSLALTLATSDTMYFSSRYPGAYLISGVSLTLPTTTSL